MLGALVHCIAARKERKARLSASENSVCPCHPVRPVADRLPAHRRRPHGAVQLAVRPPSRRQVPAADRGHRQGALDQGRDRRDPRRDALARPRLGRARILPVAILGAPRRGRPPAARARRRLPLLHDAGGARGAARESAAGAASRSGSTAHGATAPTSQGDTPFVIRLKAPREGETVIDDRVQGRVDGPECRDRRFRPAPLGRHPDLHAGGGRRRSRHGRDPRDPRRRSSEQRLPPAGDHPRDGMARADLRPCAADPRARRRQALASATARSASTPIATNSECCPRPCSIISCASAGAMATTRSSAASRRSSGSTSTMSANRRRASTSRSSRISTAITSARRTTPGSRSWSRRSSASRRPNKALLVQRHAGAQGARAHLNELADGARFLFAERPLEIDEAAAALLTPRRPGAARSGACKGSALLPTGTRRR